MRDRVLVPFCGPGEGVELLSWGQRGLWQTTLNEGKSITMAGVIEPPAGTTVQALVDALQFALCRHQTLRTRLRFDPDGTIRQVVSSAGTTSMELVDAGTADPAEVAATELARLQSYDFDYETEWPIRTATILSNGAATHFLAVYLHLALDAFGLQVLLDDLASRDPATGLSDRPVTGMTPLDQARWQQTPAAQRHCQASLRHLEKVLRTVALDRFAHPPADQPARYPRLTFRSPAIRLALRAISQRKSMDTSQVLLGLFAIAVTRVSGTNPFVTMLAVSNRFRPGFADSVSVVAQISPCLIDVADCTLDEAIGQARRAAVSAYKYGFYDPPQRVALIERIAAERGSKVDLSCFFSDRRTERDQELAPVDLAQLAGAVQHSSYRWRPELEEIPEKIYLSVDNDDEAVLLQLSADTRYLPPEQIIALAQDIEATAVQAALDADQPTGIHSMPTVP
ncbi:MAG TPA: condensation domain-containing protein, partial [Jatrophihabitans sp.]|nr:condensation domain-containing protein [Jatrophihabitans sp.]